MSINLTFTKQRMSFFSLENTIILRKKLLITGTEELSSNPRVTDSGLFSRETVYETAARLLFMAVRWTKNLTSFASLPQEDQVWINDFNASMTISTSSEAQNNYGIDKVSRAEV